LRSVQAAERELRIDAAALARVAAAVNQVSGSIPGSSVDAVEVLRWPGSHRDRHPGLRSLVRRGPHVFQQTLDELGAMRLREGKRLGELIEQRCAGLACWSRRCGRGLPEIQARVRSRLHERVAELLATVDRERVEQEIVLQLAASRCGRRARSPHGAHRGNSSRHDRRGSRGPPPRFLMQELNREANTLASKSQDPGHHAHHGRHEGVDRADA
jgi:uncharacterized protein (TIGR00255 family)